MHAHGAWMYKAGKDMTARGTPETARRVWDARGSRPAGPCMARRPGLAMHLSSSDGNKGNAARRPRLQP